jgi:acyl-CoA synthetase (AMP-forming)/AMP-acid ligase II
MGTDGRSESGCSLQDVERLLCGPGKPFETVPARIRGVELRVWKNVPPTLRALLAHSRSYGDRLAVISEDHRVSYEAQYRAVLKLIEWLQHAGIGKGDRVAIAMRNIPEWPVAFFAAATLGAVAVPLNAWGTGEELGYALRDSAPLALVCDDERWRRIAPLGLDLGKVLICRSADAAGGERWDDVVGAPDRWAELPDVPLPRDPLETDDDAAIFYTSGTSGRPKGAIASHRNIVSNIASIGFGAARTALRRGGAIPSPRHRTLLAPIPLFHVTACAALLMSTVAAGNTLVFMPRWDAAAAMMLIERERIQAIGAVPTMAWQILDHPDRHRFDLSSLEAITYGGAPTDPSLVARLARELGVVPGTGWGMTETMATVTSQAGNDYLARPHSAGLGLPIAELQIRAADGISVLPAGTAGELWVRGPMVVRGYWKDTDATAATFIGGWLRTGDIGRLDDEGFLEIVDRAKDMIIRGGENIYSVEVENCLTAHPDVAEAALIGQPHTTLGEEPIAVVVPKSASSPAEQALKDHVRQHLAAFKVPVRVIVRREPLPRNANGKVLKRQLKEEYLSTSAAA